MCWLSDAHDQGGALWVAWLRGGACCVAARRLPDAFTLSASCSSRVEDILAAADTRAEEGEAAAAMDQDLGQEHI